MLAIVDFRAGNLTSVKKSLDYIGAESRVTSDPDQVARAEKIILPGVGHFSATAALHEMGLRSVILQRIAQGVPFLGICVGMQWMFEASVEAPETPGAGLLTGTCEHFPVHVKSPHVGWNSLECDPRSRLFRGVSPGSFVYFTHSFRAPIIGATVARSEYGGEFSAAVEWDNMFGVQFHPEKSGQVGLKLLENFCVL
jgi:imidazole glycerol-phosphate synthase subunit HisH